MPTPDLDLTPKAYDFIVVGSGPSGSSFTSTLSRLLPSASILLLEAGKKHSEQAVFDRYSAFRGVGNDAGSGATWNWGYATVPQTEVEGERVDYSRGKGLGGTSLINFLLWNRGARDDWAYIEGVTSSSAFAWDNVKAEFDGIEGLQDPSYRDSRARYVAPDPGAHGASGPVHVEYAEKWENHIEPLLRGAEEFGWKVNRDLNSGDPIGVGLGPATARAGRRVTAQGAYLGDLGGNVEIRTGVAVYAKKEVVLSAGALDSPKILLLSGIGPREQLEKVGIEVVHDVPGVGQNLQDHCHFPITAVLKPGIRTPHGLKPGSDTLAIARAQFAKDGSGPLSYVNGSYILGFLKEPSIYETDEFKSLDMATQTHLKQPTVPTWELGTGLPLLAPPPPGPPREYMVSIGVLMNPQSRGTVTLKSSDVRKDALFDPKLMTHPYDRRVLITAARSILEFMASPSIAETIEAPLNMPQSGSEEDVLAFVRKNLRSTWHMSGTCKMGAEDDEMAVVDSSFTVKGVKGLRVVDLSVLPVLVNAHPVGAAYLMGVLAGKVVGRQYEV
ncbi:putative glucose dehydrogenase [Phaeosphaeria sp. MPI-PUGE-AT-0046c]|nr:putative glucose dehydrogenase [Phaeosphaeria sp. MPI-PUGE-AT-0046c]